MALYKLTAKTSWRNVGLEAGMSVEIPTRQDFGRFLPVGMFQKEAVDALVRKYGLDPTKIRPYVSTNNFDSNKM